MSLTRRTFASAALTVPLLAQQGPEPSAGTGAEELAQFVSFARQVIAPTTVTDESGRYVPDIKPHEFRVFDKGAPQKITVEYATQPLALVVAIQANNTVESVLPNIKKLGPLIENTLLGERGEAAILAFDHRIRLMQDWTRDGDAITKALHKINAGSTTSAMVDAVSEAARMLKRRETLSGNKQMRKVVLLIAETRDKGSEGKTRQALLDLQFGNIVLYSVNINRLVTSLLTQKQPARPDPVPPGARHVPAGALQTPEAVAAYTGHYYGNYTPVLVEIFRQVKSIFIDNQLEAFTKATGGTERSFLTFRDLERVVQDISEELQSQYMISYSPSNMDEGGYHEIQVQVARAGLKVRTRPGYWMAAVPEQLR
jgi:VWFA-related protein